ncbi:hypothetical protein ANN_01024 [Periplaneta americana]|uniref:Reverse transcriptase domain-containing protein n=1 Tax=Periplaneta americana TaxID=6978 RepID=A0ABQ8TSF1_PERAM|nr:hypothetical protein ANN_01024 [Periplaneta americana]
MMHFCSWELSNSNLQDNIGRSFKGITFNWKSSFLPGMLNHVIEYGGTELIMDDQVVFANSEDDLQRALFQLNQIACNYDLKISTKKTKKLCDLAAEARVRCFHEHEHLGVDAEPGGGPVVVRNGWHAGGAAQDGAADRRLRADRKQSCNLSKENNTPRSQHPCLSASTLVFYPGGPDSIPVLIVMEFVVDEADVVEGFPRDSR